MPARRMFIVAGHPAAGSLPSFHSPILPITFLTRMTGRQN